MLVNPNIASHAPYTICPLAKEHRDTEILKAEEYMDENFAGITSVDQLENTQDSVEEITQRVGYEDSVTFRQIFRGYTNLSPREYRDRLVISNKKNCNETTWKYLLKPYIKLSILSLHARAVIGHSQFDCSWKDFKTNFIVFYWFSIQIDRNRFIGI